MQFSVFVSCMICTVLAVTGFPNPETGKAEKIKLAYSVWEPAEGESKDLPPIILLHGMTLSKEHWYEIAPRLVKETGRKVYALDARDHGDSPWTGNPSNDAMTEDVNDFMNSHNIPKATLVGHSQGGRISMSLAITHPEKVEKIVLEDISTAKFTSNNINLNVFFLTMLQNAIEVVPSGVDERQAKMFIAEYLRDLVPGIWDGEENRPLSYDNILIKKENGRYVWKANIEAIKKSLKEGKFSEIPDGSYDGDAFFIYGGKSMVKVVKEDADEVNIKKQFPKALFVEVAEADHDIHGRFPDKFLEEVSKFINV